MKLNGYMRLARNILKRQHGASLSLSALGLAITQTWWGLAVLAASAWLIAYAKRPETQLLTQLLLATCALLYSATLPTLAGLAFGLALSPQSGRTVWALTAAFGVFVGLTSQPIFGGLALVAAVVPVWASRANRATLARTLSSIKETLGRLTRYRLQVGELNRFIPSQASKALASGKTVNQIKHRRRHLVVFFSDIEGFAAHADQMESASVAQFLNHYLTAMADIVEQHGGVLNKFMGDGIMVTFGDDAASDAQENARCAAHMALAMKSWVAAQPPQPEMPPLRIRMGMSTGYCTVGTFGAPSRLEYTAIGRQVNLAARLEQAAEAQQILVTDTLYRMLLSHFDFAPGVGIELKGFRETAQTYALLGPLTADSSEHRVKPASASSVWG